MDIWAACKDAVVPGPLSGRLIRIVESQEQIATNALVDDLEEQRLLEELLETSKPPLPPEADGLHYLLATPFRYPPLAHGSRFGTRHQPAIFYGSLGLRTVLAEAAYYRLVFLSGMAQPPPGGRLTTEHCVFGAEYAVQRGLRLHGAPFDAFEERLTDPARYEDTQHLGGKLREHRIEAFEYRSARDRERGINVGLFTARALSARRPAWQQTWLCDTRAEAVSFYSKEAGTHAFERAYFLIDGALPIPAI